MDKVDLSKISTKFRDVRTVNGHPFDVAKSALQKYIRRGMVTKAQYIACELDMFRFVSGGQSQTTNFYNRLRIITLEDIGLACPEILPRIDKYLRNWLASDAESVDLLKAIRELCTCPHSRFYSHLRMYMKNYVLGKREPETHFFLGKDEGLRDAVDGFIWCLENKDIHAWAWLQKILDAEKTKEKYDRSTRPGFLVFQILEKIIGDNETIKICKEWYKTLKVKEQFLCCIHPVYVYIFGSVPFSFPENEETLKPYENFSTLEIDDYIYDMHTKIGKKAGRNEGDFAVEGSLVAYEKIFDQKMTDYYTQQRAQQGSCAWENDEFTLKCRAQLICSAVRPDTYFAVNRSGKNVVVKGPYLNQKSAMTTFKIQSILQLFPKINSVHTNIKLLLPNMFTGKDATPLGCRTKITEGSAYCFVVMDDLCNFASYPVVEKSSKLWPPTKVVDFEKFFKDNPQFGFGFASEMTEKARFSFLLQIAIRYVFKMGDFASRNFLRVKDKVYNLDTEGVDANNAIRFSKKDTELLLKTLRNNREKFQKILQDWLDIPTIWDLVETTFQLGDKVRKEIKKIRENPEKIFSK